jgi:hypothetical protein
MTTRRLRTVTNCFVMSLAVADWLVGISVMPPAVALQIMGKLKLLCFLLTFISCYRQVGDCWFLIQTQLSNLSKGVGILFKHRNNYTSFKSLRPFQLPNLLTEFRFDLWLSKQTILSLIKVQGNLFRCLIKHHPLKLMGYKCISPRILNHSSRWRWEVSFTPWLLYPRWKSPQYPLDSRLGGLQSPSGRCAVEKILDPTGTRIPTPWSSSP